MLHLQGISLRTEHGEKDLCEVVCDRLRLLTGAVLMDEQQSDYRVCSVCVDQI